MRPLTAVVFAACLSLAAQAGCSPSGRGSETIVEPAEQGFIPDLPVLEDGQWVELKPEDKPQPFDVYLTWLAYDERSGLHWHDAALFVWNGKAVGRGTKGFEEVLRRMSALPHGTRVLVYPCLSTEYSSGTLFDVPFLNEDGVTRIVFDRKLRLIFSPFDHTGKIHPQLARFWHFRWAEGKDCDAWVTWKNYDGRSDPKEAVYLWNGKEVGAGLAGFIGILSHLDEIRPQSKVLMFPFYVSPRGKQDQRKPPFEEYRRLLEEVVYRRQLIVLQSHDENATRPKADRESGKGSE